MRHTFTVQDYTVVLPGAYKPKADGGVKKPRIRLALKSRQYDPDSREIERSFRHQTGCSCLGIEALLGIDWNGMRKRCMSRVLKGGT
jgi:hypothetical protein